MSAPSRRVASSHPSRCVSTMSLSSGSPISGKPEQRLAHLRHGHRAPRARRVDPHLPPRAERFGRDAEAVRAKPVLGAGEGFDERGFGAQNYRVGRQDAGGGGRGQVEHRAEHDATRLVLRLDRGRFERGGTPSDLLRLLVHRLQHLGTAERRLTGRLLQRKDRGTQLVAQAPEQVVALLVRHQIAKLGASPCQSQAAVVCPAHEAPTEVERFPRAAGRRKVGVRGPVAAVLGNRLHPAANSHPHRRGGVHWGLNGRAVALRRSAGNPRGHCELERGAVAIARGDPDPTAERSLHDKTAEIKAQPEPSLRAVAPGRPGLFEE